MGFQHIQYGPEAPVGFTSSLPPPPPIQSSRSPTRGFYQPWLLVTPRSPVLPAPWSPCTHPPLTLSHALSRLGAMTHCPWSTHLLRPGLTVSVLTAVTNVWQKRLKGDGVDFGSQSGGTAHRDGEGMGAGDWGSWWHSSHRQEAESSVLLLCLCSPFYSIQTPSPCATRLG